MERRRDRDDDHQVEHRTQFDQQRDAAPGRGRDRRDAVLGDEQAERLQEVARRSAVIVMPIATSAMAACSALGAPEANPGTVAAATRATITAKLSARSRSRR